jgi:predicted house-cleaning noncanonical NTP pyrophosphatase (MazG superfamily)
MVELDKEYNDNLSNKLQEEEDEYVKDHIHQIMHPTDPN